MTEISNHLSITIKWNIIQFILSGDMNKNEYHYIKFSWYSITCRIITRTSSYKEYIMISFSLWFLNQMQYFFPVCVKQLLHPRYIVCYPLVHCYLLHSSLVSTSGKGSICHGFMVLIVINLRIIAGISFLYCKIYVEIDMEI